MFTIKWMQANGCVTLQESQAVGVIHRGTKLYKQTAEQDGMNTDAVSAIVSMADGSTIPVMNDEKLYVINSNGKTVETVYKQSKP